MSQVWIFDASGERDAIVAQLERASFTALIENAGELVTHANVELRADPNNPRKKDRLDEVKARYDALRAPGVKESYERAVKYAAAEISDMVGVHVGVTLRCISLEGGGTRIWLDVSEYA